MDKKVLCVDLGNVLIEFNGKPVYALIKKEKRKDFIDYSITRHDTDELHLWELYQHLKKDGYFLGIVDWEDFVREYEKCLIDINWPLFYALEKLKTKNVSLVCITDNNHFMFTQTTLKCPDIFELFRRDNVDQFVLSYDLHSLKRHCTPFRHASAEFGFAPREACFIDDQPYNIDAAVKAGYERESCFLYNIKSKRNLKDFLKFLERNFPAK